jgi:dTDP-4-dehydrorhamnose reductase
VRVLVTGAGGQLGQDLVEALRREGGHEVFALDHRSLPVEDADAVDRAVDERHPEVVIHAAAMTNVDRCEDEPGSARQVNAVGTANVAGAAERVGAHLVCVSTDYVFDGRATRPYRVSDDPNPVSIYGRTKLEGERACPPDATIVRTSWLAGAGAPNFVSTVLGLVEGTGTLRFVDDQRGSPTFTADLAPAIVALARDRRPGVFHVTNGGEASRFELAREVVAMAGGDPGRVVPIRTEELQPARPAKRPAYSVLDNSAFAELGYPALPPWPDGLARLVSALRGAT